jgi:hypothetical protein
LSTDLFAENGLRLTILVLLLLVGMAYGLKILGSALPLFALFVLFVVLLGLFAWVVWRNILDASDRGMLVKAIKLWQ